MTSAVRSRPIDMLRSAPIRVAAVASMALCAVLSAQTRRARRPKPSAAVAVVPITLPPAPVTVAPAPPPTPAELPAHPAGVTYANGLLTVEASNSSLNQILRDISRETSIKITGGVADERVFGKYGPAPAAQVLSALLDGTGSNMLLLGSNGEAPAELILTPRSGGVTPPNPNAAAIEDSQQSEDQSPKEDYPFPPNAPANPPESEPARTTPPAAGTQQQSPNGVKTPQDIFNELQKMRRQQAQQQTKPQ